MRLSSQSSLLIALMKLWQKVKFRPDMISHADMWRLARVVLICFPEDYRERQAAELAVRSIVEACPRKRFCVLTTKVLPERWLNVELIRLRKDDLNLFSMPNSTFIKYIQEKTIDAVIDLWPSFNLTNACLSRRSGAALRVCFGGEHASAFYNLLVVPTSSDEYLTRKYEIMVETILNLERFEAKSADR
ncbi:hypothetical protein KAX22_04950 [bacterium]|nr:hypothetical protein [bacterium]